MAVGFIGAFHLDIRLDGLTLAGPFARIHGFA